MAQVLTEIAGIARRGLGSGPGRLRPGTRSESDAGFGDIVITLIRGETAFTASFGTSDRRH